MDSVASSVRSNRRLHRQEQEREILEQQIANPQAAPGKGNQAPLSCKTTPIVESDYSIALQTSLPNTRSR